MKKKQNYSNIEQAGSWASTQSCSDTPNVVNTSIYWRLQCKAGPGIGLLTTKRITREKCAQTSKGIGEKGETAV
jgi:hypothetical protein